MKFLRSLNTHLTAIVGVVVSALGFIVQPQISGIVVPLFKPQAQTAVATVLNVAGLALAYFGRPTTIHQSQGDTK